MCRNAEVTMKSIFIKQTNKSPEINFNYDSGELKITGNSLVQNSYEFYTPLLEWIDDYVRVPKSKNTKVFIKVVYFTTDASGFFIKILKRLEQLAMANHLVIIKWYYEEGDIDMRETIFMFRSLVPQLNLEPIVVKEVF